MASLENYHRNLDYSYAPGLFPTLEAVLKRPELVKRVLVHPKLAEGPTTQTLQSACQRHGIRMEEATRVLSKLGKDNVYAAAVFRKVPQELCASQRHLVLHQPADMGNLGTMLRSALAFGFHDIAVIRPAADPYDPQVVRASMGALFSLRLLEYAHMDEYTTQFPAHHLYPFMLTGARSLQEATQKPAFPYALVMGNEGSGLPESFSTPGTAVRIPHSNEVDSLNLAVAASIGMYAFAQAEVDAL